MDYMYPGVFLAYFLFFLLTALTLYFLIRSVRDGYWGKHSEEPARRMMEAEDESHQIGGARTRECRVDTYVDAGISEKP